LLARAALEAAPLLRSGGSLLLELGGDEADLLRPVLAENGYREVELLVDEEGDPRALFGRH
jgi:release factor glutamine methyltransferase